METVAEYLENTLHDRLRDMLDAKDELMRRAARVKRLADLILAQPETSDIIKKWITIHILPAADNARSQHS